MTLDLPVIQKKRALEAAVDSINEVRQQNRDESISLSSRFHATYDTK